MKYLKKYNESKTPREQIKDWEKLNGDDGYYGTYNSRIISLESSLKNKALKIMSKLNQGFLWTNERETYNKIYNYLLDGYSEKKIKNIFSSKN